MHQNNENNTNKKKLLAQLKEEVAHLNTKQISELNECALKNMQLVYLIRNSLKEK
jgi:hypothetical protein